MAVSPGLCASNPCGPGYYEFIHTSPGSKVCKPTDSRVCLPCSIGCPDRTYQSTPCNLTSDRGCAFKCSSSCTTSQCRTFCSSESKPNSRKFLSIQMPIFIAEVAFAVVFVSSVFVVACLYISRKLQNCRCSDSDAIVPKARTYSFRKEPIKVRPDLEDLKIRRAQMFTYGELERATGGFREESLVGKGSFSCVFRGALKDGTLIAVKKDTRASDEKNSKEFRTELDLLSRLNHAHLLNLLGYCEEGGARLLVYEFMAHGSLYGHLHGKDPGLKQRLDWVRRVTIAVQAARGIEYLHGYACPPVIHRDIKSSNILIDEEHNARVADFGLSLLGPVDSSSPLSEPPAVGCAANQSWGYFGNFRLVAEPPAELEALKKIAATAGKCVRMRGKDRPSMDKVTTALERALVLLMGSPCNEQPILPTEVVLGSSRLHKKGSQRSSNQSCSENDTTDADDQFEYRAPSWITFPSVTSSQRRSEGETEGKNSDGRSLGNGGGAETA
ncbi:hypothetical protein ZIOFF_036977 [Zingiber officinale]|uniref:Protein kinase domain-containing protein n=1 Tax=Zingiber officinale TaxID=94328 RepID=A0A8J5L3T0_ZINOF|nr:hypothetical protein ZIOFF_036977 [Zingiber officinale]